MNFCFPTYIRKFKISAFITLLTTFGLISASYIIKINNNIKSNKYETNKKNSEILLGLGLGIYFIICIPSIFIIIYKPKRFVKSTEDHIIRRNEEGDIEVVSV